MYEFVLLFLSVYSLMEELFQRHTKLVSTVNDYLVGVIIISYAKLSDSVGALVWVGMFSSRGRGNN